VGLGRGFGGRARVGVGGRVWWEKAFELADKAGPSQGLLRGACRQQGWLLPPRPLRCASGRSSLPVARPARVSPSAAAVPPVKVVKHHPEHALCGGHAARLKLRGGARLNTGGGVGWVGVGWGGVAWGGQVGGGDGHYSLGLNRAAAASLPALLPAAAPASFTPLRSSAQRRGPPAVQAPRPCVLLWLCFGGALRLLQAKAPLLCCARLQPSPKPHWPRLRPAAPRGRPRRPHRAPPC
jgi:hypothetical protein